MKRILLRLLAFGILAVVGFLPSSCRRILEFDAKPEDSTGGEVTVRDNVFVLDSLNSNQLLELYPEYLIFKNTPTLRNGRLVGQLKVNELKKGDIVLGYASDIAPGGFAAKVVSISKRGEDTRVDYEEPELLEIFQDINRKFTISFDKQVGKETFEIPVRRKSGNTFISAKGSLSIDVEYAPRLEFELVSDKNNWKKARIEAFVDKKIRSSCNITGEFGYNATKNIICQNLTRLPKRLPLPWPIYVRPVFRLDADITLSGSAKIGGEWIESDQTSSAGILYDGTSWKTIESENKRPIDPKFKFEAVGKIEAGVSGNFDFYLYQFFPVDCDNKEKVRFSIGLGVRGYVGIEGKCQVTSTDKKAEAKVYLGIEEKLSARAKLFGLLDASPTGSVKFQIETLPWTIDTDLCSQDSTNTEEKLPDEVEQSPTAVSTADPHLTSFDRVSYSFMAVGEFVATKSTANNFQVQVRQSPYPNSTQVSVNTGIAIQAGNDRVCVYPNPNRLFINGQSVPLTFTQRALSGGGSIEYAGNRLKVLNGSGDLVEIRLLGNDLDYYITPTKVHKGKLSGLFGNYDNNASNDLMLADGKTVANSYASLYPAFSNSWRIKQAESMFVYDTGKTTESYTDLNYPRSEIQLTAAQRTEAEQICRQAGVTEPAALQGCIVDIAMTGNRGFAERAKQNEIFSNAKSVLSVSNFGQYRNEFLLGSGTTINGNTALLPSKGTIRWNDAYLNRNGYETEVILSVNAPSPCLPLFDLEVIDNQATGDPNQNYLRMSANGSQSQVELVNSGVQPTRHPVNLFDGNRHRIRVQSFKGSSGSQTVVRLMVYIDQYEPVIIERSYSSASLAGYLYPMLKNETLNCSNGQISIHGWSFRSL